MQSLPQFILFGKPAVEPTVKDDAINIVAGFPTQNVWLYKNDPANGSKFGVWDCQAGTFKAKMDGIIEFCSILEGEAEITNMADGSRRIVRAGDAFVMESGLETEWTVPTYIKKYFAISSIRT